MMISEAKALAEKAMSDPMGAATQGLEKVKFWWTTFEAMNVSRQTKFYPIFFLIVIDWRDSWNFKCRE